MYREYASCHMKTEYCQNCILSVVIVVSIYSFIKQLLYFFYSEFFKFYPFSNNTE